MNPYEKQKHSFLALRSNRHRCCTDETTAADEAIEDLNVYPVTDLRHMEIPPKIIKSVKQDESKIQSVVQNEHHEDDLPKILRRCTNEQRNGTCMLHFETEVPQVQKKDQSNILDILNEADIESGIPSNSLAQIPALGSLTSITNKRTLPSNMDASKLTSPKPNLSLSRRRRRLSSRVFHKMLKPAEQVCMPPELLNSTEGQNLPTAIETENIKKASDEYQLPYWLEPTNDEILLPQEYCCFQMPAITAPMCHRPYYRRPSPQHCPPQCPPPQSCPPPPRSYNPPIPMMGVPSNIGNTCPWGPSKVGQVRAHSGKIDPSEMVGTNFANDEGSQAPYTHGNFTAGQESGRLQGLFTAGFGEDSGSQSILGMNSNKVSGQKSSPNREVVRDGGLQDFLGATEHNYNNGNWQERNAQQISPGRNWEERNTQGQISSSRNWEARNVQGQILPSRNWEESSAQGAISSNRNWEELRAEGQYNDGKDMLTGRPTRLRDPSGVKDELKADGWQNSNSRIVRTAAAGGGLGSTINTNESPGPSWQQLNRQPIASPKRKRQESRNGRNTSPRGGFNLPAKLTNERTKISPSRGDYGSSCRNISNSNNTSRSPRRKASQSGLRTASKCSLKPYRSKSKLNLVDRSCTTYSSCGTQLSQDAKRLGSTCSKNKSGNPICSVTKLRPAYSSHTLVKKPSGRLCNSRTTSKSNLRPTRSKPLRTPSKTSCMTQTKKTNDCNKSCCHCRKPRRPKGNLAGICCRCDKVNDGVGSASIRSCICKCVCEAMESRSRSKSKRQPYEIVCCECPVQQKKRHEKPESCNRDTSKNPNRLENMCRQEGPNHSDKCPVCQKQSEPGLNGCNPVTDGNTQVYLTSLCSKCPRTGGSCTCHQSAPTQSSCCPPFTPTAPSCAPLSQPAPCCAPLSQPAPCCAPLSQPAPCCPSLSAISCGGGQTPLYSIPGAASNMYHVSPRKMTINTMPPPTIPYASPYMYSSALQDPRQGQLYPLGFPFDTRESLSIDPRLSELARGMPVSASIQGSLPYALYPRDTRITFAPVNTVLPYYPYSNGDYDSMPEDQRLSIATARGSVPSPYATYEKAKNHRKSTMTESRADKIDPALENSDDTRDTKNSNRRETSTTPDTYMEGNEGMSSDEDTGTSEADRRRKLAQIKDSIKRGSRQELKSNSETILNRKSVKPTNPVQDNSAGDTPERVLSGGNIADRQGKKSSVRESTNANAKSWQRISRQPANNRALQPEEPRDMNYNVRDSYRFPRMQAYGADRLGSLFPNARRSYFNHPHADMNRISMFPNPDEDYIAEQQDFYRHSYTHEGIPPLDPYYLANQYPLPQQMQYGPLPPNPLDTSLLQPTFIPYLQHSITEPRGILSTPTSALHQRMFENYGYTLPDVCPMPGGDTCTPRPPCPCCGAPASADACSAKVITCQNDTPLPNPSPLGNLSAAQMTQLIPGCSSDGTRFYILPLYSNLNDGHTCIPDQTKSESPRKCEVERRFVCACKKKKPPVKKTPRKIEIRVQRPGCGANTNSCGGQNDSCCCPFDCSGYFDAGCGGFS